MGDPPFPEHPSLPDGLAGNHGHVKNLEKSIRIKNVHLSSYLLRREKIGIREILISSPHLALLRHLHVSFLLSIVPLRILDSQILWCIREASEIVILIREIP